MTKVDVGANGREFISYFNTMPIDLENDEEGFRRLWNRDHLAATTYESKNFLENTLIIWFLLALVIIFFPFLFILKATCCSKRAQLGIEAYKFNVFVKFFLIFYLPLLIACQINSQDGKKG